MIKYILFGQHGSVKRGEALDYTKPKSGQYLFIFLARPSKQEIDKMVRDFRFNRSTLENFSKETHSRRYISTPFQFVMRGTFLENSKVMFATLLFALTNQVLLVASSKEAKYYEELVDDLYEEFRNQKVRSIVHVFCNFLQEDVDENYEVLGKIEEQIRDVEKRAALFNSQTKHPIGAEDIIYLKTQLLKLSRQFWATTRVISLIRMGVAQVQTDRESEKLLGDVHETFLHQIDVAAVQKEMVSDTLNIYSASITNKLATVSNELNIIMKKLAAYGLILLLPTLIASIYGMNFEWLPFANHVYGFILITMLMFSIMLFVYLYAKKNNWL